MSAVQPFPLKVFRSLPAPVPVAGVDGHRIPVRRFGEGEARRPVVMLHGLQSHAGWFVQTATRLADSGFPVYTFDRCGSGVSEVDCDGGEGFSGLLAEIDAVAMHALAARGHDSVYVLGHCFGAIPALLYAALHRSERVAGLVLATPALYTHTDIVWRDKMRVVWSVLTRRAAQVPVPIDPEEFSELGPFVDFIRSDPLVRTAFPARFLFELARARGRLGRAARQLRAPLLVAMAGADPICDNARGRRLLDRVVTPKEIHEYAGARHILEFSGQRDAFFADLTGWLHRQEKG